MTKIKVPTVIQVGSHHYKIYLDKHLNESNDGGMVVFADFIVLINPARISTRRFVGLLHELLHLADYTYNNFATGEEEIWGLAEGMAQMLCQFDIELDWSDIPDRKYDGC